MTIAVAGKEDKPVARAKVAGTSHRFAAKLQPNTEYAWSVAVAGQEIGAARFRTLTAAAIQDAQKRRPAEKAEFSDRLMYALLLQEMGAVQEAQEAWAKLAQERTDLPELASLASSAAGRQAPSHGESRTHPGRRIARFRSGLAEIERPPDPLEYVRSQMYEPTYASYVA